MLAIPNTTTVPSEASAGFVAFPPDAGALTPFANGFLSIANNSAQISIRKGPTAGESTWTPYVGILPTLVPLTTDRAGRSRPDYIWGVKFIDGVPNTHAQVSGALFQPGEANFVPSTQITGTVSASGGFNPPVSGLTLFSDQTLSVPAGRFTFSAIPAAAAMLIALSLRGDTGVDQVAGFVQLNNDGAADYTEEILSGLNNVAAASVTSGLTGIEIGQYPGATSGANIFGAGFVEMTDYASSTLKARHVISRSGSITATGAAIITSGNWTGTAAVTRVDILPGAGNWVAGSRATLWTLS